MTIDELIAREEAVAASARERMNGRDRRQADPFDLSAMNVALGKVAVLREARTVMGRWVCTDPIDRCTPETDHGTGCGWAPSEREG